MFQYEPPLIFPSPIFTTVGCCALPHVCISDVVVFDNKNCTLWHRDFPADRKRQACGEGPRTAGCASKCVPLKVEPPLDAADVVRRAAARTAVGGSAFAAQHACHGNGSVDVSLMNRTLAEGTSSFYFQGDQ